MEAHVVLRTGTELRHTEVHFHGFNGGIEVQPRTDVTIHPGGRYLTDFSLTSDRVDQKQLETLMAHGLTPEEAVDVIIMGLLQCGQ